MINIKYLTFEDIKTILDALDKQNIKEIQLIQKNGIWIMCIEGE